MTDTEIVWEEPRPLIIGNNQSKWRRFATVLAAHPGRWAVALDGMKQGGTGSLIRQLRDKGLEATSRVADDGTYTVYARWPDSEA